MGSEERTFPAETRSEERTFAEPWDLSDVSFVVESRHVYANKLIMSMWSPVFKAMFSGNYKESDAAVVQLPGKLYDDVLELVRVLHPPNKPVDEDNVKILLPLAHEYQIDDLTKRCEEFLLCREPSIRSLVLAEEFSLKLLETQCLDHVNRSSLKALVKEPEFSELSDKTRIALLLDKATRYEHLLDELRAVVTGKRPLQTACLYDYNLDKTFHGRHNTGTESSCKTCAIYMTKLLADKLRLSDSEH